jgi:hypothetical protein
MWNIFFSPRAPQNPAKASPVADFRLGRRFDPGAPGDVFITELQDPVILFQGRARGAGSLSKFQPVQIWFGPQAGIQGIGGVQAGAYVGQRLIDPSQLDAEGGE